MSDLISREDAIEALDFNIVHMTIYSNDDKNGTNPLAQYNKGLEDGIKAIRALPSVEPERTAKVIEHDASITDTDGYKYLRTEYICGNCKKKVIGGDEYCSHCGARLEWNHE